MGILARFNDIMKANVNALLDKCEDPAKMIDQTLRNLEDDLAKVKKETAAVMVTEKEARRKYESHMNEISRASKAAENALIAGNEDDARRLIEHKQELESQTAAIKKNYEVANASAVKIRQMHDKLVADIDALKARRNTIKATVATAKATKHISEIKSNVDTSKTMAAFDRCEEKANRMLDEANALNELNEGTESSDELVSKYVKVSDADVDAELERLKEKLGLAKTSGETA